MITNTDLWVCKKLIRRDLFFLSESPPNNFFFFRYPFGHKDFFSQEICHHPRHKNIQFSQRDEDGEIDKLLGWLVGWLVGFLWHIKLCRLFNDQIHFYVNNQFYLKQFSLA